MNGVTSSGRRAMASVNREMARSCASRFLGGVLEAVLVLECRAQAVRDLETGDGGCGVELRSRGQRGLGPIEQRLRVLELPRSERGSHGDRQVPFPGGGPNGGVALACGGSGVEQWEVGRSCHPLRHRSSYVGIGPLLEQVEQAAPIGGGRSTISAAAPGGLVGADPR